MHKLLFRNRYFLFSTPTEEPHSALEVEMRENLCAVLARFYSKCNNEGFLNNPSVSLYISVSKNSYVSVASGYNS